MKISLLLSGLAALLIQMYVTALPTMLPTSTTVLEYEDYLAFMQQKQQEQREKRAPSSHCSLFAFTYTLENEDGCVGYIPLFGCAGRCSTGETPNYYQSRQDANVPNAMISTCKCCSHKNLVNFTVNITMQCTNDTSGSTYIFPTNSTNIDSNFTNSTINPPPTTYTIKQELRFTLTTDCGCTSCV